MSRKNGNARKRYPVSLHQLQRELGLTVIQRVKVGTFIKKIVKGGVTL
jgi:hypothetical protein